MTREQLSQTLAKVYQSKLEPQARALLFDAINEVTALYDDYEECKTDLTLAQIRIQALQGGEVE